MKKLYFSLLLMLVINGQFVNATNNCLLFNGSNYVSLGNFGAVTNWTIECWFNSSSVTDYRNILHTNYPLSGASNVGVRVEQSTSGSALAVVVSATDPLVGMTILPQGTLFANQWHHLAIVGDKTNSMLYAYVDGALKNSMTCTNWPTTFDNFNIGRGFGATREFVGALDKVNVWNYALSSTEINVNMNKTIIGTESGLISSYNFDQTSGTTLTDIKGVHNGTLVSSPTWQSNGNALDFDGVNDYVTIPDNNSLDVTQMTIETWVKWNPAAATDIQFVCAKAIEQMEIHTGAIANRLRFIPTTSVYLDVPNCLPVNQWTHIACVYNPSASFAAIYINGVLTPFTNNGVNPLSTAIGNSTSPFYIGQRANSTFLFKGDIDELKVWNTVRTQAQIQADMAAEATGKESGLAAYYNFNQGFGSADNTVLTTLYDRTGNANNGSLINFAKTGATSNFVASTLICPPILDHGTVSNITQTTASVSSNITSIGWQNPTARGVCFATTNAPTISNSKVETTGTYTTGAFTVNVSGLTPNTVYYARAYATNLSGTSYSEEVNIMQPPGNALAFDGLDDWVAPAIGDIPSISNNFTIELLVNPTVTHKIDTEANTGITGITVMSGSDYHRYAIYPYHRGLTNESDAGISVGTNGVSVYEHWSNNITPLLVWQGNISGWTQIAIVYTNKQPSLYVNGVLVHTGLTSIRTNICPSTLIGGWGTGIGSGYGWYKGAIDEVRIWNRSLTAAEIIAGMNTEKIGTETGLNAYYNFNQGVASGNNSALTTLYDKTSNSYNGTLTNFTKTGSTSNFVTSMDSYPALAASTLASVTQITAAISSNITTTGWSSTTVRGVCYATTTAPTISSSKVETTGTFTTGAFTVNLSGLVPATLYYARAYATNSSGTSYGAEVSFTTLATPLITVAYANVNIAETVNSQTTVGITSNTTWTATSDKTWLTVSPSVATTGNATLTLNAKQNPTTSTRTAVVTLTATGAINKTITVTQTAGDGSLTITAGGLATALSDAEINPSTITYLTLKGIIDAQDFKTMRDNMPLLSVVNLSGATIAAYFGTGGTNNDGGYSRGFPANAIPEYAFCTTGYVGKSSITNVIMPSSVTSIGTSAFNSCTGITTLTIPSTVTVIGDHVFFRCTGLTGSFIVPEGILSIYDYAFHQCTGLTSISIPSTVTSIANGAFETFNGQIVVDAGNLNYSSLDGVLFDKNKTQLIKCPQSKTGSYSIPTTVTSIVSYAFVSCASLTAITLPSSLTTIGSNAFANCNKITSLSIPSSVTSIGDFAFYYDSGLTSINAYSVTPINLAAATSAFYGVNNTSCRLHVPAGSQSAYSIATVWKDFTNIAEGFVAPTVTTQTVSAITATTATGNGNITNLGDINPTQYGVVWSTATNPTVALTTKTTQGIANTIGAFTSSINGLIPSTTYYVKAYTTNNVGTSYGSEVSFTTNAIEFYTIAATSSDVAMGAVTGGASYADGASVSLIATPITGYRFNNWMEGGTEVSINATYTFAASVARTLVGNFTSNTITVTDPKTETIMTTCTTCDVVVTNSGTLSITNPKTINDLTVLPGGKLILTNPLIVNNVIFKADDVSSFSTSIGTGSIAAVGSVKYVKTLKHDQWYFISFPCDVEQADITKADGSSLGTFGEGVDWDVEYYDGAARAVNKRTDASNWKTIGSGTKLEAYKGYIFWLKPGTGTVDVAFKLNKSLVQSETETGVPVIQYGTSNTVDDGWNLIGQPYLSKYAGGKAGVNYMTFPNADGGLTYTTVSKASNGNQGKVLDPFTAYFVQVADNGTISFDETGRQFAPASVATESSDLVQINFTTPTGTDNTNLIMDEDKSPFYQIGEDMVKWLGTGTPKPQVYTVLGGVNYAYNALPVNSVINLPIGFYTKTSGVTIINADATAAKGLSTLLLTDKTTGTVTNLLTTNYNFTASAGTNNTRFVLSAQRITTGNSIVTEPGMPTIISANGKLLIKNITERTNIRVYDTIGRCISNETTSNNSFEIPISMQSVYTVQLQVGIRIITKKIVVNL